MTVRVVNRYSGDPDAIIRAGDIIGPLQLRNGATSAWLGRIELGPHAGQFISIMEYPDWATHARMRALRETDAVFRDALAALLASATLEESTRVASTMA